MKTYPIEQRRYECMYVHRPPPPKPFYSESRYKMHDFSTSSDLPSGEGWNHSLVFHFGCYIYFFFQMFSDNLMLKNLERGICSTCTISYFNIYAARRTTRRMAEVMHTHMHVHAHAHTPHTHTYSLSHNNDISYLTHAVPQAKDQIFTLVVVRHGQSEWNKSNQFTGYFVGFLSCLAKKKMPN